MSGLERFDAQIDVYSIIIQKAANYRELLGEPPIEVPPREYNQRSESSGLPDGSFIENFVAPIGEPLDKAILRMSKEANKAWKEWVDVPDGPVPNPELLLGRDLIEAMLTEEEYKDYIRVQRMMLVEELKFKKEETHRARRLLEETTIQNTFDNHQVVNRFYEEKEVSYDPVGNKIVTSVIRDRCQGNPNTKVIVGTQVSNVDRDVFSPSHAERLELLNMTRYQTEVWRNQSREEEDDYIPNISPEDDPDFIAPSDISSRNFVIYPPAARPYNIVFRVWFLKDPTRDATPENMYYKKIHPKDKTKKDYTSLSSMKYMLDQKGVKYHSVAIDEFSTKDGIKYTNCKFEIDLRVTYTDDGIPNPRSYSKVDPSSVLGMWLLKNLNEQPHLFDECIMDGTSSEDDNTPAKEVLAVFYKAQASAKLGNRVYWVYVKPEAKGIPRFIRGYFKGRKKIAPQIRYEPLKYYTQDTPNYQRSEAPFIATVRVSYGFGYYVKADPSDPESEDRYVDHKEVVENFVTKLENKGYQLFKIKEDAYDYNLKEYIFVHKDARIRDQRRQIFSRLKQDLK